MARSAYEKAPKPTTPPSNCQHDSEAVLVCGQNMAKTGAFSASTERTVSNMGQAPLRHSKHTGTDKTTANKRYAAPGPGANPEVHPQEAAVDGSEAKRLVIDPFENVLIGSQTIRRYLGIQSMNTLYEWHEAYGLPVMKRPDGLWMTSITAIDEWIWMASQFEVTNRPYSRGDSQRADLALEKARRRVDRLKAAEKAILGGSIINKTSGLPSDGQ